MADDIAGALGDKRDQLERELQQMTAPPREQSGISFGKRVGDGTSIAVDRLDQIAIHDQLQTLLADVRRALAKLAEDSYGSCDNCGDAIPPARLEALPWAVLCVRCAGGLRP